MLNQNNERSPTPFNPVSELYHFGIKNMKWGLQRFQLKDGTWTPEGLARRREREGFGDDERTGNGKYSKEEIVNSGNVRLVSKYKSELSTTELRDAINRIDTERKLKSLMKDAERPTWQKRAEQSLKMIGTVGATIDGLVTWATKGNGKTIADILSGKADRDAQITAAIKRGDIDWLDQNFDTLSIAQQKAAVDAMKQRHKFKTRNWDPEYKTSEV